MNKARQTYPALERRRLRVRKKVKGTADRPRLAVYKSLNHIYAQIVDDDAERTLVAASSLSKEIRAEIKSGGNVEAARVIGGLIARRALEKNIRKLVFDRGGYVYHGRLKALADAVRAAGIEF
jgi:large subunit ribosomal protein L18